MFSAENAEAASDVRAGVESLAVDAALSLTFSTPASGARIFARLYG